LCNKTSRADGIGCFEKKLDAGIGIGIHEKDPIAAGAGGAGIARPADLVDRLEYDGYRRSQYFRSTELESKL